jgi:hypothetical protein
MLAMHTAQDDAHLHSGQWLGLSASQYRVGRKLEDLSIKIMEAYNGNIEMDDYLLDHLNDNFVFNSGRPGTEPMRTSPKDHIQTMKQFFSTHPSWKVHATNPSSLVDEENGKAEVFATSTISGYQVDLARERVTQTKWRKISGQWKVVEHNVMIGGGVAPI